MSISLSEGSIVIRIVRRTILMTAGFQRVKSDGRDFHDGPVLELKFMQKWTYLRQLTLEKNQRLLKMCLSKKNQKNGNIRADRKLINYFH